MKKIIFLGFVLLIPIISVHAQCTGMNTYNLTVSSTVEQHPTDSSPISIVICAGGVLIDSASCCTRMIHVLAGGDYEAYGLAYGIVYIQSGGTFNAHGSTGFFTVFAESGATILNFTGPTNNCTSITFAPSACGAVTISENHNNGFDVYPNPASDYLMLENLSLTPDSKFQITDAIGNVIISPVFNSEKNSLQISSLPTGLYFLTLVSEKREYHCRFIKQ